MPTVAAGGDKRVVFERPDGMAQIMGTDAGFAALPVTAESFVSLGEAIPFASLVRVTARAAYYRCPMIPQARNTFHEAQR